MRKLLSLLLTLAMIFTMVIGGTGLTFAADSTEATTMKIAGTDGTVTVTNEKGKEIAAKVDTKLLNGYTIKTAAASYCFISLDDSKAIKLGQNTKVKVEKSNKKIELNLKSGEIYFDVDKKLSGNESMNIKTGNMTTGIRGTSGVARILEQIAKLQLFSGSTQSKAVGLAGTSTTLNIAAGQELNASFTDLNAGTNPSQPTQPAEGTQPGQQAQTETAADGVSISTNPIAMDNFAVRSIIETSAIKSGVSATQALAAKAEEIIEKAAELLQKLDITQEAKNQIEKVTAEPEKLDTAKANAEAQAAIEQTLNEQTIETAQQEAAKVEGTTTDTTESKVLENVEVKNEAGANASALSLSEDGTGTTATAGDQTKPSGGHSGGSAEQEPWISGCNEVYDGNAHPIANVNEVQRTDYYFWFFVDDEVQKSFLEEWNSREPMATVDEDIALFTENYAGFAGSTIPTITDVDESETYYYVAIQKDGNDDLKVGEFTARIEPVEVTVKWFLSDIRSGIEFGSKAQIAVNSTSAAVSNRPVAVAGIVGEDGSFKQVTCMAIFYLGGQSSGEVLAELAPVYERVEATELNRVYTANITGLTVYRDHTTQEPESSPLKLSNYKLKQTPSLSFSYSYILDRSVSSEFFDESNRANWTDKTKYDIAFVKDETNGNYAQYRYSDGQLQDSGTATIDEIFAILGDSESQYVSVYIDTGSDGQSIETSNLPSQLSVVAGACTRAVYIRGAGFFDSEASHSISFRSEGAKNLLVQLGDGEDTPRYTFMEASELSIGQRVEFNNTNGNIIADNVRIEGHLFNKNSSVLALSETATGSICVVGNGQSPTGILYLNDESVIEDDRVYTFASDGSASSQIEPMLVVSKKGDVRITSGTLRHYVNTTAYRLLNEGPGSGGASPTAEELYTLLENVKDAMFGTNYINSVRYTIRSKGENGVEHDNYGLKCTYAGSEVNGRIGGSILNGSSAVEESQNYFWITTSNFLYDDSPYIEFKFPTSVFSESEYH